MRREFRSYLSNAFNWGSSDEGDGFWRRVNRGETELSAKILYKLKCIKRKFCFNQRETQSWSDMVTVSAATARTTSFEEIQPPSFSPVIPSGIIE